VTAGADSLPSGVTSPLDAAVLGLPGAGPVTATRLAAQGILTVRELLLRLPRAYDDLRRLTPLAALDGVADGRAVLVRGTVRRVYVFPRRLLDVVLEQDGASVRARWFRPPPGMSKAFAKGAEVALAGPLRTAEGGVRELAHPMNVTAALARVAAGERGDVGLGLRPRYAPVEGVGARVVERLVAGALARLAAAGDVAVEDSFESLPAEARLRLGLPTLRSAFVEIHAPPDALDDAALAALVAGRGPAHRRLALEGLLAVQAVFLRRRARIGDAGAPAPIPSAETPRQLARVRAAWGFAPTAAQARAIDEIAGDLAARAPMQRLLVGDVGSGKTAVAFAAAALVAAAGGQTLLMAPTEVLAEQHARTLRPLAARLGFAVGVLTASTTRVARAALFADVAAGRIALLVGTQAVLDRALTFADLRLVVVDEQHRFGVAQRAGAARRDGAARGVPHLLVMSATPIPRTLALARHGDLDASILDERPAGRPPPATLVCRGADETSAALERLREALARGEQAFVVCHVRERARRAGAVTAVARFADLRRRLAPARVGLLHGALAPEEKDRVLRAFSTGGLDVLVATTVVELGIDVPGATLMIVEDADRFGLAQLHQLRGRVGRGAAPGLCLLCTANAAGDDDGTRRLEALASTSDGFRIAEADLEARGPGELFGTRQAGGGPGGLGLAETFALVALARREAEAIVACDPRLERPEHAALARAVRVRAADASLFAEEAG
jgi:ATP-dependent DNA helicase RecG